MHRRGFLKRTALAVGVGAAAVGAGAYWVGSRSRVSRSVGKKVIVIGIDGMDPLLAESMMTEGLLPNFAKLRASGAFSPLGTSIPPQSPVAWANFINGAGPGSHGIFDFVHRHPEKQCSSPFYSGSETVPAEHFWEVGEHPVLRRQGVPFWDYLDKAGIASTFYDLPSNYPPSPSHYGHHRCISGMGVPDMLGTHGTYQHFADSNPSNENSPDEAVDEGNGKLFNLKFEQETARTHLDGPVKVEFLVHRDRQANAAVIELQGHRIVLREGQWSHWLKLNFELLPWYVPAPNKSASGICRFYLQEVAPNFKLYLTPLNIDPSSPAVQMSEPNSFIQDLSERLGLFYTTGFQEAYQARKDGVFNDDEYRDQANSVLEERLAQFQYALDHYEDGLLFFYFSSSDLQSHLFWWWNSPTPHPLKTENEVTKCFAYVKRLYQTLDRQVGEVMDRFGGNATIIVMSDHGFANFGRQFNLNTWLRDNGYLFPADCSSIMQGGDVDWSQTRAYGLGINGLYLNLKGRERDGIVEPGEQQQRLLAELVSKLEAVVDEEVAGQPKVISNVYRADRVYAGNATALAPDLIVGYDRGYRASWETCEGKLTRDILLDNTNPWGADHCADARKVPGILFCNRPLRHQDPALVDVAPSILGEFGLPVASTMTGRNLFTS
jgi:predicted AlkP superfamily phosphohydrolase/phosphomutase